MPMCECQCFTYNMHKNKCFNYIHDHIYMLHIHLYASSLIHHITFPEYPWELKSKKEKRIPWKLKTKDRLETSKKKKKKHSLLLTLSLINEYKYINPNLLYFCITLIYVEYSNGASKKIIKKKDHKHKGLQLSSMWHTLNLTVPGRVPCFFLFSWNTLTLIIFFFVFLTTPIILFIFLFFCFLFW